MQNSQVQHEKRTQAQGSRLHTVPTLSIKLIPRISEFLRNNITKIHQITESLLQSFQGGGSIYKRGEEGLLDSVSVFENGNKA